VFSDRRSLRIRSSPRIPGRTKAIAEFSRSSPSEPAGSSAHPHLTAHRRVRRAPRRAPLGLPRIGSTPSCSQRLYSLEGSQGVKKYAVEFPPNRRVPPRNLSMLYEPQSSVRTEGFQENLSAHRPSAAPGRGSGDPRRAPLGSSCKCAGFRLTRSWGLTGGVAVLGVGVPQVGSVKFALVPECLVEPRQ
jgi:hypothetical protein